MLPHYRVELIKQPSDCSGRFCAARAKEMASILTRIHTEDDKRNGIEMSVCRIKSIPLLDNGFADKFLSLFGLFHICEQWIDSVISSNRSPRALSTGLPFDSASIRSRWATTSERISIGNCRHNDLARKKS